MFYGVIFGCFMYIILFINYVKVIKQLNLVKNNPNHTLIVEFVNAFNSLYSFELIYFGFISEFINAFNGLCLIKKSVDLNEKKKTVMSRTFRQITFHIHKPRKLVQFPKLCSRVGPTINLRRNVGNRLRQCESICTR